MTLSRRRVLTLGGAGLVGLGTIPIADWVREANAMTTRVRYDAASPEGKDMLKIYADAVGKMRAMDPKSPLAWQFQFYTHWMNVDKDTTIEAIYGPDTTPEKLAAIAMWDTCRGHITWSSQSRFFVPWHRMYVLYFERIIQHVSGATEFTLPYWNYTEAATKFIPEEFRDPSSPLFMPNRNSGINSGTVGMESLSLSFLSRPNYDGRTGFNSTLDGNPHGQVHVQVGDSTNMGSVPNAANDPVFWVHHSNVDRCWSSWNAAGGENPDDDAFNNMQFQFYDVETQQLVTATTKDFKSTAPLGYEYSTLIGQTESPVAMLAQMPKAAPTEMVMNAASEVEPMAELGSNAKLGAQAMSLAVALPEAPLTEALGSTKSLYLIIEDLRTDVQPGVAYEVYVGGGAATPIPVGQINFFNAASMDAEDGSGTVFSFDVSAALAEAHGENIPSAPVVTIAPVGEPASEAVPLLGNISFVFE